MELKIVGLTKNYQDIVAVNDFSYTMTNGVYGLLGVNGAGKTTLMRMLCTLIQPTRGEVLWNGQNISALGGEYRKALGYLPQDFGYYPDFTLWDYLMYIASIKGLRNTVAKKRAQLLIEQVGLKEERNKKMKKLSGGMKRRAGIAQAMLGDPKLLILDEPTAGLDPNERIRFRNLISELAQERIVLLSTHIVSDVEYIAKEILLMQKGKLAMSGTVNEIIENLPIKVWSIEVPKKEISSYFNLYKIANVRTESDMVSGGKAKLRILSAKPPAEDAVLETAVMEDVFLYYFGETAGEQYGQI